MIVMAGKIAQSAVVQGGTGKENEAVKLMSGDFVEAMAEFDHSDLAASTTWAKETYLWKQVHAILHVIQCLHHIRDACHMSYLEEWREQWPDSVNNRWFFFHPDAPTRQAWDLVRAISQFRQSIETPAEVRGGAAN